MGRALPCLIRIVAACPRLRLIRVCASHNKTFPGRGTFILIQPGRRDPCSQDWPGYAASERPFWMPLAGASGRRSVLSGGIPGPVPRPAPGSRLPAPGSRLPAPGSRLPAPGSRLPAPGGSYLPEPFVSPNPARVSPDPACQESEPRVPGQANAPLAPGRSIRGPTVRSGRPAAVAGASVVQGVGARPAQTTRCSGSRSPQCYP
jgi:hypothetical protein